MVFVNLGINIKEESVWFAKGFEEGWNSSKDGDTFDEASFLNIILKREISAGADSIYNSKEGRYEKVEYREENLILAHKGEKVTGSGGMLLVEITLSLVIVISIIYFWICFIRVIFSANKNSMFVFTKLLEERIKKCGISLALYAICNIGLCYCSLMEAKEVFAHDGYTLEVSNTGNYMLLVIASGFFMVAELFTIARKMKEEQELTI